METEEIKENAGDKLRHAETYLRENPVPAIVGALVVGLVIGMVVRSVGHEERPENMLKDRLEDLETYLRRNLAPVAKKGRRAYSKSADAVRDAVESAVDHARDIDVEDYTDPIVSWWTRFWKRCCR